MAKSPNPPAPPAEMKPAPPPAPPPVEIPRVCYVITEGVTTIVNPQPAEKPAEPEEKE